MEHIRKYGTIFIETIDEVALIGALCVGLVVTIELVSQLSLLGKIAMGMAFIRKLMHNIFEYNKDIREGKNV